MVGLDRPLCRDPASQLNFLFINIFSFVYERANPPWRDLAIDYACKISPRRAGKISMYRHLNSGEDWLSYTERASK